MFLDACPTKVAATFIAVLDAVREAPPPAFSGGGKWEAMHGTMAGYHEIRLTGPGRRHYRLFCLLDNGTPQELAARGFDPQIGVINGMVKANTALFRDRRSSSPRFDGVVPVWVEGMAVDLDGGEFGV